MFGRFVLFSADLLEQLAALPEVAAAQAPEGLPGPRFNIGPTMAVAAVHIAAGSAQVRPARWGLIPPWKTDLSGPPLFNARAETVSTKPSFRDAFAVRRGGGRCLVPLNGYYEWALEADGRKQPYFISRPDPTQLLWAAGLYSQAQGQLSVTMVTTAAIPSLAWLHDRSPLLLEPADIATWLAPDPAQAAQLLRPAEDADVVSHPADPAVGNIRNDHPQLPGVAIDL